MGYHNNKVITPNIDRLAREGVILENHYAQPVCTPSRAALLTGMYPYHIGSQNGIIKRDQPTGLTLNYTLLPQELKAYGYDTHMVGKWHLGYCKREFLPTQRGFDTFYGFWKGFEDYYTKERFGKRDFKDGDEPVSDPRAYETYSNVSLETNIWIWTITLIRRFSFPGLVCGEGQ